MVNSNDKNVILSFEKVLRLNKNNQNQAEQLVYLPLLTKNLLFIVNNQNARMKKITSIIYYTHSLI
ncbi:hypothetical protein A1OE_322 [Candidatus Endolissoclinum faulkneri L2]|uniref:Uncharacterized protein n=1 Tax=Candidatus Endolissoclinum faulkneri L2 TaxID=1193729 RepID=K7YPM4_9PROT|nr:hypothetical protein A1OE_322 [Candidatus Endolissoclinum faulkneri L2]